MTSKNSLVTACNAAQSLALSDLRSRIWADYQTLCNWRLVGEKWGINKGLAYKIAVDGYEPVGEGLRQQLGLPPRGMLVQVWVFLFLALNVKVVKPRAYRKWRDMPVGAVKWALENRQTF